MGVGINEDENKRKLIATNVRMQARKFVFITWFILCLTMKEISFIIKLIKKNRDINIKESLFFFQSLMNKNKYNVLKAYK
jgi:hypothetical protein